MKLQTEEKNTELYRSIAYVSALFLFFGIFASPKNDTNKAIFDLFYDLISMTTITFGFLWIKKRILIIALISYTIHWNIELLCNPIIYNESYKLLGSYGFEIRKTLSVIGFSSFVLGVSNMLKNKYLTKTLNYEFKHVIGAVISFTILVQVLYRI